MGCGAENSKKKCAIVKDIPEFKRGKIDILLQPILTFIRWWCYSLIKILRGQAGWGRGGISIKAHLQNYLKICVAVIFIVHIGFQSLRKESFFSPIQLQIFLSCSRQDYFLLYLYVPRKSADISD